MKVLIILQLSRIYNKISVKLPLINQNVCRWFHEIFFHSLRVFFFHAMLSDDDEFYRFCGLRFIFIMQLSTYIAIWLMELQIGVDSTTHILNINPDLWWWMYKYWIHLMPVPTVIKAIQTRAPALIPNETKANFY